MALETGTYINSLNASNPTATDALAQADDHLRLIKSTIKASFPNVSGAATPTHTELNYLDITTLGTSEASKAVTVDSNGDLIIPDSDKFKFGAGSDMQLYHDATNSYITNATGELKIATETSGIAVKIGHTTSETTIQDNLTVTGDLTVSGDNNIVSFTAGMVIPYAGLTAPSGWLLMFGQSLNTYTYRVLHAVISNTYGGTAYNAGVTDQSGVSTTFTLPDLRGRVVAGQDDMGGSSADRLTNPAGTLGHGLDGDTLGASGGAETHVLTTDQIPAHTHTYQKPNAYSGSTGNPTVYGDGFSNVSTGSAGGGTLHNNLQPTFILNYIIKT
jgi:microcystin-dependent protein